MQRTPALFAPTYLFLNNSARTHHSEYTNPACRKSQYRLITEKKHQCNLTLAVKNIIHSSRVESRGTAEEWRAKALEWDAPSISQNQVCVVKMSLYRLLLGLRGGEMQVGGAALGGPAELWRYLALIKFLSWESKRRKERDEKLPAQSEFHSNQFCCRSVNVVLCRLERSARCLSVCRVWLLIFTWYSSQMSSAWGIRVLLANSFTV